MSEQFLSFFVNFWLVGFMLWVQGVCIVYILYKERDG